MRPILPLLLLASGCGSDLWIETETLDPARVALPYEAALAVSGDVGPVTWFLEEGDLPPGLELGEDGVLSGSATASGTWAFTVGAEDGEGEALADLELVVPHVALMTGFEPFGGYDTNPSWEALLPLHEVLVAGLDVRALQIPVEWDVSWDLLSAEMDRLSPRVVVGTGMAGSVSYRLETLAQNLEEGEDNAGVNRDGEPVVEGAPDTLDTLLPVDQVAQAVEDAGWVTYTSDNAGTYLCNFIFYHLVWEATQGRDILTGFVHVPPAPYEGSMTVEDITGAHQVSLGVLAAWLEAPRVLERPRVDGSQAPVYFGL